MKGTHSEIAVGVRELRDNLRYYLDESAKGVSVVITERGRPIARLGQYDQTFQALVDEGHVRLADPAAADAVLKRKPVKSKGSISELVERNR